MPITAATIEVILPWKPSWLIKKLCIKRMIPIGIRAIPHSFHQLIQGTDHLRLFLILHGFRLQGQSGNIRFIPNFFQTGHNIFRKQ